MDKHDWLQSRGQRNRTGVSMREAMSTGWVLLVTMLSMVSLYGCAARDNDTWVSRRPLGQDIKTYQPPRKLPSSGSDNRQTADATGVITLRQAAALALMYNPELRAFAWEVRSAEARQLQAGLLPNPELGVEVEQVGGTGELSGFGGADTKIELSQLIELSDKAHKRRKVASIEKNLAGWDYESKRLDVLTKVTKAFVEVLAAQRRKELAGDVVDISEQLAASVAERVEAGKDPPLEKTRAEVVLAKARMQRQQVLQQLKSVRRQLAATWACEAPAFEKAQGQLDVVSTVPDFNELMKLAAQNPDAARWAAEVDKRKADLELEKAGAYPDPTVFGGLQRLNESSDDAVVFGVSIPIPAFDRNQGNILAAGHGLAKARNEQRAARIRIYQDLSSAWAALNNAFTSATQMKDKVLPGATKAFNAASNAYRQGKVDYIVVLDAQKTLFENRAEYIDALQAYHKSKADVERLVGQGIDSTEKVQKP